MLREWRALRTVAVREGGWMKRLVWHLRRLVRLAGSGGTLTEEESQEGRMVAAR